MKKQILNRAKLMMGYNPSKTLNENIEEMGINDTQIDEQGLKSVEKAMKAGVDIKKLYAELASALKVSEDVVKMAAAKDVTTLTKELKTAVIKDLKSGFKSGGTTLGKTAKEASKSKTIHEILNAGKPLNEKEIIAIIERNKTQAKELIVKAEQQAGKIGKTTSKAVATDAKAAAADVKAVEAEVKNAAVEVKSATEAGQVVVTASSEVGSLSSKFKKAGEYIKKYKASMFEKLKGIKSRLNLKNIILYGLAGYGIYRLLKDSTFLKKVFGDDKLDTMPDCVVNLEGMEWGVTSKGDAMIYTKNEFNPESKGHGGLKFFPSGRVWTMDNQMSGSYSCKSGGLEVTEETITEQASRINIVWDSNDESPIPVPTGGTASDSGTTITYTQCKGFPLTYGCKSDDVKKIQVCIGLPGKYQTGNYGPITMKALGGLKEVSKEKFDEIVKKCEGGQVSGTTSGGTTTTTGTTTGSTTTVTGTTTSGTTTSTITGETPADLYARLVKDETLVGRLKGRRIVYKGPDLSKEEREKLELHMKKMGYRVSRDNFDFRKGDKIVFKRNKDEETTEPTK